LSTADEEKLSTTIFNWICQSWSLAVDRPFGLSIEFSRELSLSEAVEGPNRLSTAYGLWKVYKLDTFLIRIQSG